MLIAEPRVEEARVSPMPAFHSVDRFGKKEDLTLWASQLLEHLASGGYNSRRTSLLFLDRCDRRTFLPAPGNQVQFTRKRFSLDGGTAELLLLIQGRKRYEND